LTSTAIYGGEKMDDEEMKTLMMKIAERTKVRICIAVEECDATMLNRID